MNRLKRLLRRFHGKITPVGRQLFAGSLCIFLTFAGCKNTVGKKIDNRITKTTASRLSSSNGVYIVKDGRDWLGCAPHIQVIESSKSKVLKSAKKTAYKLDSIFAAERSLDDSLAADKRIKVNLIYELTGKKTPLDCFWDKALVDEVLIIDIKTEKEL